MNVRLNVNYQMFILRIVHFYPTETYIRSVF